MVRINTDISLGHLITIGTLVGTLAGGWGIFSADVKANAKEIAALDQRVSAAEQKVDGVLARLAEDRVELTSILTQLQSDVRYLRAAVDELKQAK